MIHSLYSLSPWFLLREEHAETEGCVNACLLSYTSCHILPVSWNPVKLYPVLALIPKLAICAPNWTYEMQLVTSPSLLLDVTNIPILHKVAVTNQGWPKMLNWDKLPLGNPSAQTQFFPLLDFKQIGLYHEVYKQQTKCQETFSMEHD